MGNKNFRCPAAFAPVVLLLALALVFSGRADARAAGEELRVIYSANVYGELKPCG